MSEEKLISFVRTSQQRFIILKQEIENEVDGSIYSCDKLFHPSNPVIGNTRGKFSNPVHLHVILVHGEIWHSKLGQGQEKDGVGFRTALFSKLKPKEQETSIPTAQ